jgi:tryptophan synthase alpha chain
MTAYPIQFATQNDVNLIPFIMSGDPSLEVSLALIERLEKSGVTAIELGVPFSDPQADGPVIQAAAERALAQGVTLSDILALGRQVRQRGGKVPLILFSYFNPLLQYGLTRIAQEAANAGFSGMIVPDLPFEESRLLRQVASEVDLPVIPLVAPTSKQRIQQIVSQAEGFVYCVSSLGATGMRSRFADNVTDFLQEVRELSPVPTAVGFGISNADQVSFFQSYCDGVIVGSALVKKMEQLQQALLSPEQREAALQEIEYFVRDLKGTN